MHIVVAGEHGEDAATLRAELASQGLDWEVTWLPLDDGPTPLGAMDALDALVCFSAHGWNRCNLLLHHVRDQHPLAARIVLMDGHRDEEVMHALDVVHRVLPVPLDGVAVIEAIEGMATLRGLLDDAGLKQAIERAGPLPAAPRQYLTLTRMLRDPSTQAGNVVDVVSQDPALVARVLRLSNSAYYSGGREISDLRTAVIRLGQDALRQLVLASEVFSSGPGADVVRERALRISRLSAQLLPGASVGLAGTAGLLSQVGMLLPPMQVERDGEQVSLSHGIAGAYLLGLWGLPAPIVEAVAHHQQPAQAGNVFWVTGAVHVAAALVEGHEPDLDYLRRVGRLDQLPRWRALADSAFEPA
ncbi:HD-like signal output (HDOD) domain, no enzymatic activity [Pseudoxanthomonas sp. GM95]|uniref:HDOD domain-containing protein n=1 Tax=Pseudoxanthomonas sp. GM95 TaxID=1881043 RepID=UPI0008D5E945|nr:HDOD domain-containing protein [Pseudoxanthomonas sp. GM95]SEK49225.1 HD-like signal output (HDOD) domain, no enzymatic activity [Pseudoxanthomonas sp. GM95]